MHGYPPKHGLPQTRDGARTTFQSIRSLTLIRESETQGDGRMEGLPSTHSGEEVTVCSKTLPFCAPVGTINEALGSLFSVPAILVRIEWASHGDA